MSYVIDLSKTPKELLVEMINFENQTAFTQEHLTFGIPANLSNGRCRITCRAYDKTDYELTFWRMDLAKLFNFTSIRVAGNISTEEGKDKLLAAISLKYKIALPKTDFSIEEIGEYIYLKAKSESLIYFGRYRITLDVIDPETGGGNLTYIYASDVIGLKRRSIVSRRVFQADSGSSLREDTYNATLSPTATLVRRPTVNRRVITASQTCELRKLIIRIDVVVSLDLQRYSKVQRRVLSRQSVFTLNDATIIQHPRASKIFTRRHIPTHRTIVGGIYTLLEEQGSTHG